MPFIIEDTLTEADDEPETSRSAQLMVVIEIAMVAIAVIAAALLCVGAWWWLR